MTQVAISLLTGVVVGAAAFLLILLAATLVDHLIELLAKDGKDRMLSALFRMASRCMVLIDLGVLLYLYADHAHHLVLALHDPHACAIEESLCLLLT